MSTEQACVVRVCMKVLNVSISIPITIFENRLPLPLWRPCPSYWPRPMLYVTSHFNCRRTRVLT